MKVQFEIVAGLQPKVNDEESVEDMRLNKDDEIRPLQRFKESTTSEIC